MKKLVPIIVIAVIANAITFSFYNYAAGEPQGSDLSLAFALTVPAVWIIALITMIIIAIRRRKAIFKKGGRVRTFFVLLFGTPIPFIIVFLILSPPFAIYQAQSGYYPHNGYTIKNEEWNYPDGKHAVTKYFKLNSEKYEQAPASAFKRDSTWVYFDKTGDTTKMEWYKNGRLIKTLNKKKRQKSPH